MNGNENFSFKNKLKNTTLKLRFQYEQSVEHFILQHQHHRYHGICMFCIFVVMYPILFICVLLPIISYNNIILSSFFIFIIPMIFLFLCLYFYTCRESWILDSNGLTQKFDTIFSSTTKNIPLKELQLIEYRNRIKSNRYPNPWHHVVAKTYYSTPIIYCGSLRDVTPEECNFLADTMQKILLTLQKKRSNI